MIGVEADRKEIRISIPTEGMSPEAINAFVGWLRAEAVARKSRLTDEAAWRLSEEIKAGWWEQNKGRFTDPQS
jgi:hypothetical protein